MNYIDEKIADIETSISYHERKLKEFKQELKVYKEHKELADLMTEPKEPVGQQ